jgi:hypothetical protein
MKYLSFKKFIFFLFFNILIGHNLYSQDEYNKWVVGIGINAVDYFPIDNIKHNVNTGNPDGFFNEITNAQDHWNIGGPKINVTRYLKKKFSFDAGLSLNKITKLGEIKIDDITYIAIDGNVQYNIFNNQRVINPFVFAGGGYTFADRSGGTFNSGIGANLWFSPKFGLNAQWAYKYNSPDFALLPHFYYSLSVVMKLGMTGRGGKRFMWRDGASCF